MTRNSTASFGPYQSLLDYTALKISRTVGEAITLDNHRVPVNSHAKRAVALYTTHYGALWRINSYWSYPHPCVAGPHQRLPPSSLSLLPKRKSPASKLALVPRGSGLLLRSKAARPSAALLSNQDTPTRTPMYHLSTPPLCHFVHATYPSWAVWA